MGFFKAPLILCGHTFGDMNEGGSELGMHEGATCCCLGGLNVWEHIVVCKK